MKVSARFNGSITIFLFLLFVSSSLQADQNNPLLNSLFNKLHQTNSIRQARAVEVEIMRIWNFSGNKDIDQRMNLSDTAMRERSFEKALDIVTTITQEMPQFSEGWNLQATILFFMGRYKESLESVEKTLALEPRHFGAMIGKGDMLASQGRLKESRWALQGVMKIYPLHQRVIQRLEYIDALIKIRADSYV
ncbi:MAG: hypothetical protein COB22_06095 [Cycloclasticus sp.]|nr:MAG: hypothetical protein COB22_06095 [Cycloclasticus sp.]